jgi:serine/threonine protein kinase
MWSAYEIHEQLYQGARSRVMRAVSRGDGQCVVLKESVAAITSAAARARSQREFSLAAPIHTEHVAHYLALERERNYVAIVEEAFGDGSLADLLSGRSAPSGVRAKNGSLPVKRALALGIQIAQGIGEIHAHEVIHRAIHPGNILVDTQSWSIKIADFSEASLLDEWSPPLDHPDQQAMPLLYVSPEQTGRMNRRVDYRTDFYSLGATLYHVFAGDPPFVLSDPLALVHAHLALVQTPLSELDSSIPPQVSRIVDKLLAKSPEDRYQSAVGIAADLETCLAELQSTGQVSTEQERTDLHASAEAVRSVQTSLGL